MPNAKPKRHSAFVPAKNRPTVEVADYSYQPSKKELEEDLRKGRLKKRLRLWCSPSMSAGSQDRARPASSLSYIIPF